MYTKWAVCLREPQVVFRGDSRVFLTNVYASKKWYGWTWETIQLRHNSWETIQLRHNSWETIQLRHNSWETIQLKHNSWETIQLRHNSWETIQLKHKLLILLGCRNHLNDRIISLRVEFWVCKTSLTRSPVITVSVPRLQVTCYYSVCTKAAGHLLLQCLCQGCRSPVITVSVPRLHDS